MQEEDHKTFVKLGSDLRNFKSLLQVLIEAKYSKLKPITPGDMCSDVLWIYGMKLFESGMFLTCMYTANVAYIEFKVDWLRCQIPTSHITTCRALNYSMH